jgi:hypothetical protein
VTGCWLSVRGLILAGTVPPPPPLWTGVIWCPPSVQLGLGEFLCRAVGAEFRVKQRLSSRATLQMIKVSGASSYVVAVRNLFEFRLYFGM